MMSQEPRARRHLLTACVVLALVFTASGCDDPEDGGFQCLNDGDCPDACTCDTSLTALSGVCMNGGKECTGSCDAESCPIGEACELFSSDEETETYACMPIDSPGNGDLGAECQSDADCDPMASDLGAFCCLNEVQCGANLNQCVEDCSTFSSGVVQVVEGGLCQDNSECGSGLFCCLVPDAAGNCDFALDQSCTCRAGGSGTPGIPEQCTTETPCDPLDFENPTFCDSACPAVCAGGNTTANFGTCIPSGDGTVGTCVCDCFEGCL